MTVRVHEHGLQPHTLLAQYQTMVMARAIERRLWVLERIWPPHQVGRFPLGRAATHVGVGMPTLACSGFEAVQVAAAAALRPGTDWLVPCPRDLALCLAMGLSPLDVMLAVFARGSDPGSAGRQSPGTLGSRPARIVMTSASAGRQIVHAAGIAYASKVRRLDEVTVVCTDERGTLAGDWHEGINFAGAHSLPLICLVEDLAGSESPVTQHSAGSAVARAEGYGLAGETVDGGDFASSLVVFGRAVQRARSGDGATLIHAQVPNLSSAAPDGKRLAPEELEALAGRDPIDRMRRRLLETGVLDATHDDHLQRDCAGVVEAAVEQARIAPSPQGPLALENVFSAGRTDD